VLDLLAIMSTGFKAFAVTAAAILGAGVGFYLQAKAQEYYKTDIAAEVKGLVDEEEREERDRMQRVNTDIDHRGSNTERLSSS